MSQTIESYSFNNAYDREFPLFNGSWTTALAAGALLTKISLPFALLNTTYMLGVTPKYKYFRCKGVRLSIRVTSNKFVYGKLIAAFNPIDSDDACASQFSTPQFLSGSPHTLISASASEAAVLDVPFMSYKRYIELTNYATNEMGALYLMVLNPLNDVTSAATSAQVLVTAHFIDSEFILPQSNAIPYHRGTAEAITKSSAGLISNTLETMDQISETLKNVPLIGSYANKVGKIARPLSQLSSAVGLDMPTTLAVGQLFRADPFADHSHGKGLYLGRKIAVDPENSITTKPIVGGSDFDEMAISHIVGTPSLSYVLNLNVGDANKDLAICSPNALGWIPNLC